MVKNYMEILVDQAIDGLISNDQKIFQCTCSFCMDNIRAIALNRLKPFYVTSKEGEVFGSYGTMVQGKVDIISEILKAKEIVEKNPKHD